MNDDIKERLSELVRTDKSLIYYFGFDEKEKHYKVVYHQGHKTYIKFIDLKSIYNKKEIRTLKLKKLMKKIG